MDNIITVGGVDIGLAYTIRAQIALGKLNGGHSIQEFFNTFSEDDDEKKIRTLIEAVKILHDAYDRQKGAEAKSDGLIYEPTEIDEDAFYDLTVKDWTAIETAIVDAITKDAGVEVETEPVKTKGKGKKTEVATKG